MKKTIFILLFLVFIPFVSAYSIDTTIDVWETGKAKVSHTINVEESDEEIVIPVYSPQDATPSTKDYELSDNNIILYPKNKEDFLKLDYYTDELTKKDKDRGWEFFYSSSKDEKVEIILPRLSIIDDKKIIPNCLTLADKRGKVY